MPENLNMKPAATPQPGQENEEMIADTSAIPFMVWGGTYFGVSDYSGFTRESGYYSDSTSGDTFMDS